MRQVAFFFLACAIPFWQLPAHAEDAAPTATASVAQPAPPTSPYIVTDVAVDVTADSAAKARDQAIAEAQRTGFKQLLEKINADPALGAKLSDNDLSTLVQNFEVKSEHASDVRYIGSFTVQFRPNAVRSYLDKKHAHYNDQPATAAAPNATPAPSPTTNLSDEPAPAHLPVSVSVASLAEWTYLKKRLYATPGVRRIDEISLTRGKTTIELGFAGTLEDLQMALAERNLRLSQDVLSGDWTIKGL